MMQKYAVIQNGAHQYMVSEGDELLVDKLSKVSGDSMEFDQVVLVSDGGKVMLGNPFVERAKVKGQVLREEKREKVRIAKYKAKSRYRKVNGFRAKLTRVKVGKIIL